MRHLQIGVMGSVTAPQDTQRLHELAEMVGLDLTDRKIWDAGIDALAAELDEAEALAVDLGL